MRLLKTLQASLAPAGIICGFSPSEASSTSYPLSGHPSLLRPTNDGVWAALSSARTLAGQRQPYSTHTPGTWAASWTTQTLPGHQWHPSSPEKRTHQPKLDNEPLAFAIEGETCNTKPVPDSCGPEWNHLRPSSCKSASTACWKELHHDGRSSARVLSDLLSKLVDSEWKYDAGDYISCVPFPYLDIYSVRMRPGSDGRPLWDEDNSGDDYRFLCLKVIEPESARYRQNLPISGESVKYLASWFSSWDELGVKCWTCGAIGLGWSEEGDRQEGLMGVQGHLLFEANWGWAKCDWDISTGLCYGKNHRKPMETTTRTMETSTSSLAASATSSIISTTPTTQNTLSTLTFTTETMTVTSATVPPIPYEPERTCKCQARSDRKACVCEATAGSACQCVRMGQASAWCDCEEDGYSSCVCSIIPYPPIS